ncbi:MAG: hypothetical protein ACREQE_07110, partial [Candidatus Binataceae bacterium]
MSAPTIGALVETGERMVPHFGALLQDLFSGLFKYNLVWLKQDAVRRSAMFNRTILEQLVPSPAFELLKSRTLLEEDKSVIAALVLGERVLEMLRSEKLVNRAEMLDLKDLEHQERELAERAAALKNAAELSEQQQPRDDSAQREGASEEQKRIKKRIEELKDAAARAAQVAEARLNQKARLLENQLKQGDRGELKRMQLHSAA